MKGYNNIVEYIDRQRLNWIAHLEMMEGQQPKSVWLAQSLHKQSGGRHRKDLTWNARRRLTRNNKGWNTIIYQILVLLYK